MYICNPMQCWHMQNSSFVDGVTKSLPLLGQTKSQDHTATDTDSLQQSWHSTSRTLGQPFLTNMIMQLNPVSTNTVLCEPLGVVAGGCNPAFEFHCVFLRFLAAGAPSLCMTWFPLPGPSLLWLDHAGPNALSLCRVRPEDSWSVSMHFPIRPQMDFTCSKES